MGKSYNRRCFTLELSLITFSGASIVLLSRLPRDGNKLPTIVNGSSAAYLTIVSSVIATFICAMTSLTAVQDSKFSRFCRSFGLIAMAATLSVLGFAASLSALRSPQLEFSM